ncbi:photosynthetic NDH subunit of subcomplex B 3, chloroplastic isoform X4 [Coffea eugenioides]|uniref:Photosynthetic NDH subunit of subcomplex B 3, chloroplastic isoform X4 n=1 Tax=Coffea arabica TaxID=13443 RepID=A0A6P6XB61_COFAR|nr:photosynthetic NDH subunit of subcomplex B 3, chloroplastic isoform X4 [Coffea arabica]XP_027168649.1 photosynthetic NDH subunit of subcomplex B 3, chloroplastic isoform X4 [Coffea eugenioides]
MGILELNSGARLAASFSVSSHSLKSSNFFPAPTNARTCARFQGADKQHLNLNLSKGKIRAVGSSAPDSQSAETSTTSHEPPAVNFAFVSSVLLPDGTPDVHFRKACGGQKLRDIMLDSNVELYGPYVVEGRELLSPRTEKEKEKLKRNPRNWRLACQTTVGKPDSTGLVVIQQLPEWKMHEWNYGKQPPPEDASCYFL